MIRETRITGRVPFCDGCPSTTAAPATVKLQLRSFPVHLCDRCRGDLFGAPDSPRSLSEPRPYSERSEDTSSSSPPPAGEQA